MDEILQWKQEPYEMKEKTLDQIFQSNEIWWVPYNTAEHLQCTSCLQNLTLNAFFPLKIKLIDFIQLYFFPDIGKGETEIFQISS